MVNMDGGPSVLENLCGNNLMWNMVLQSCDGQCFFLTTARSRGGEERRTGG